VKGDGLKGCGRGRATDGGGLRIGVATLFWVGCPGDGNCCVAVTTVPFLMGGVTTLDGTAVAAIGAVVDVGTGAGAGAVVLICTGEGCCGDGFDGVEPLTIGMLLGALAVAAIPAAAAVAVAVAAGGAC